MKTLAWRLSRSGQIWGAYAGAERRRVLLATGIPRPQNNEKVWNDIYVVKVALMSKMRPV